MLPRLALLGRRLVRTGTRPTARLLTWRRIDDSERKQGVRHSRTSTTNGTIPHRTAAALHVEDLTPERILAFLEDLETTRRNTIRTRNARLAAIHSFFRYVLDTEPALALLCQRVLAIPVKEAPRRVLGYLSDTELAHVLAQIDRSTQVGERDYLLVALLYDTGARIQQLLDLAPCDVRFAPPPFVRLFAKGRRERLTPLLPQSPFRFWISGTVSSSRRPAAVRKRCTRRAD